MGQVNILPQQSLPTIVSWGTTFLARASEEKEFVQMYGKPLYHGAIAIAQWWRDLSIGQVQAINQIDFPYWTLTLARKLAKVPLKKLDDCLGALQNTQKSVSKLSQIVNKFIPKAKLGFGRIITESDWSLIASAFDLDRDRLDSIRQKALQINGCSAQSVTTDDVIEILREGGYPVEKILPHPRIKRYSLPEVEQLIGLKVQEVVQDREEHLLAAIERSRYLETENERLRTQLNVSISETIVDITPITSELEQSDVFDECLKLWEAPFKVGDRVRVSDNTDNDCYGKVGKITGLDDQENNLWGVRLPNGDYQQFPASALDSLPQESSSASMPIPKIVVQVPIAG